MKRKLLTFFICAVVLAAAYAMFGIVQAQEDAIIPMAAAAASATLRGGKSRNRASCASTVPAKRAKCKERPLGTVTPIR